jgi:hypothetical protein
MKQLVAGIRRHGARSLQVVASIEQSGSESTYNLAGAIDARSRQVDPRVPRG